MKDRIFLATVVVCAALVLVVIGQSVWGSLNTGHGGVTPTQASPVSTPSREVVPTRTPGGPTPTPIPIFGLGAGANHV